MSVLGGVEGGRGLDLSGWGRVPNGLVLGGGLVLLLGLLVPSWRGVLASAYLTAFMFFLSLVLGSLFLVLVHHLFDANWMVPIRRVLENLACGGPLLGLLFVPIGLFAGVVYPWLDPGAAGDHALVVKSVMYNRWAFYLVSFVLFVVWWRLGNGLRNASLEQDITGEGCCTVRMRRYSAVGIFVFAVSLTLGAFYWMKSLEYQWFSTMYGVCYFAGSVWVTLATVYVLGLVLQRTGHLAPIIGVGTFKDVGTLFFAFTVFYGYIHFSQYFLIWNAAIPEETFWFVKREEGVWWGLGLLIVFGHFFVPFLALLRADAKLCLPLMLGLCVWAWGMHYADMAFNIKPVFNVEGLGVSFASLVLSLGSLAFMGGLFARRFLRDLDLYPAFPQRDPRVAEVLGVYVEPLSVSEGRGGKRVGG